MTVSADDPFGRPPARPSGNAPYVNGNHRYSIVDPETGQRAQCSRVSTYAKTISDMAALHLWEQRNVVKGLTARESLYALACSTPWEDDKAIQAIAERAREAAGASDGAHRGTALHNFTEAVDRGQPIHGPEGYLADAAAYAQALRDHQITIDPALIEAVVYVPRFQLVGRIDRVAHSPLWGNHVEDLKTARNIWKTWCEITIQLACYAHASHWWDNARDAWVPMPAVSQTDALVAHALVGTAETTFYRVPVELGWRAAELCESARAWRRSEERLPTACDPLDLAYVDRVRSATSVADLRAVWAEAEPAGLWTPELERMALGVQKALTEGVANLLGSE